MALTLTSMTNSLVQKARVEQARPSTDPVSDAFARRQERVSAQVESSRVELSTFGRIKSDLAGVQASVGWLGDPKKTATAADIKQGVQSFVNAYNQANRDIATAAARGDTRRASTTTNEGRALVAGSELRQALSRGDSLAELRKLGISQNQDGSLSIDTKALDQALQANSDQVRGTVTEIGGRVAAAASRQLAETGSIGGGVEALGQRTARLVAQQAREEAAAAAAQTAIGQQSNPILYGANGLATYQKLLSG